MMLLPAKEPLYPLDRDAVTERNPFIAFTRNRMPVVQPIA